MGNYEKKTPVSYTQLDVYKRQQVSSGRIEEYVAGRFSAEHNAKLFAEALENKIAEESGYVTNCFTPKVSIIKITQTEELVDE